MRSLLIALTLSIATAASVVSTAGAMPIPQRASSSPAFEGIPAAQHSVSAPQPPRHPFMAPNGRSNIHDDAYQTDAYTLAGPLGLGIGVTSQFFGADCASVTFDARGQIVTICVGVTGPTLYLLDPHTLATIASFPLPPRQPGVANPFQDFGGGGYFYLDNADRAVTPTTTRHIYVVSDTDSGFQLARDYDVSGVVPFGDSIVSVLPDWSGRLWFASKNGVVGTVDPTSGTVKSLATGESIGNSFAVDETGGVYIVSDAAMYRFDAAADGSPHVTWRRTYANIGVIKPGQTERGSGTTPTVMAGGYVSITDNADPMDVVVYRRDTGDLVCTVPVFDKGASDTDQSIVVAGKAMIIENNYGYSSPAATEGGHTTTPGLERVDINASGNGCHAVWRSNEIAPSVVPKLSLTNGIVYTYTHPGGDNTDPWYLTALDFRTGQTIYRQLAGAGLGFNNNYAPITIGPDGTAYVGVLGGLVELSDAIPPSQTAPSANAGGGAGGTGFTLHSRRSCTRHSLSAFISGPLSRIRSVLWRVDGRRVGVERRRPFAEPIALEDARERVSATITLRGGRNFALRIAVRPCAAAPRFTG